MTQRDKKEAIATFMVGGSAGRDEPIRENK
jgi:hypothetical protein